MASNFMKLLVTNDDGYTAPGIRALVAELKKHADVFVVAPVSQQSGISKAITFMRPLTPQAIFDNDSENPEGYTVDGTPADCVKLGIHKLCPFKPDAVISGINEGLNVGINVCHSGTVGGAFTASMFDFKSIAVSVESSDNPDFDTAANLAWPIIERLIQTKFPNRTTLNLNFPDAAIREAQQGRAPEVVSVPVESNPLGYHFQTGTDPKNNNWFWSTNAPAPKPSGWFTDVQAVTQGKVSLSALTYDPNHLEAAAILDEAFVSPAVDGTKG